MRLQRRKLQRRNMYSALQYGHFAQPLFSIGK
jgi:hypothetical protein